MVIKVDDPERLKERLSKKQLILYGAGTMGLGIAEWLDQQGIPYLLADQNAAGKQAELNRAVLTPEDVMERFQHANIIVSTNLYFDEIKNKLLKNGFFEDQILSYSLFVPQNIEWKDLEGNIDWALMRPSVELLSRWVEEDDRSVADYGAGQMYLKSFLKPGVTYYPIDYFKRFDETIVCDLNGGNFPDLEADVSVFNGVLEFLTTAETLLTHVCGQTRKKVILSYMTIDHFPDRAARRASGYVSDLSEQQIIQILEQCGFSLSRKEADPLDPTDTIYLFERSRRGSNEIR